MQRVNAEYADRVSSILNNAIDKLSLNGDSAVKTSKLEKSLEALKVATLSVLFQDETVRSDVHKFECEQRTKSNELCRLQAKLCNMREARETRRAELDTELSALKMQFDGIRHQLVSEQDSREQKEISALESLQTSFEKEFEAMKNEKNELLKEHTDARSSYVENELSIRTRISTLKTDIQKQRLDYETLSQSKLTDIESVRRHLEQQKRQQYELENHFKLIDTNNTMKAQEEEQLRKVAELEVLAAALLCDGAIALQKVWRGMKDRKLIATMKSKRSKKGDKLNKKKK